MTRDFKTRTPSGTRRGRRSSGFFWFVTGAVAGAFAVGLAWTLKDATPTEPPPVAARTQDQPSSAKPRFDFYNILPELEVVVPDEELARKAPPIPPKAPPPKPAVADPRTAAKEPPAAQKTPAAKDAPSADGSSYLLQVASFKTAADAEQLKAQLALSGLQAQIQKVTINGKDTYHRVRAGPFKGKEAANQARALLSGKGLEPIAIKLK